MYKSKQQIDKHVIGIFSTIKNEKDRQCKGFQIAKLYFEVKEYDTAKKYLEGFLVQRDNFAPAYKLIGNIFEAQNNFEKAVSAYKRSLDLDDKQKDVIVKICELYCQLDVDPEKARYWAERVEKVYPDHQVSYQLRERAIQNMKGDLRGDNTEMELLISKELMKRPGDSALRAKMMRLFIDTERVNEAYEHVMEIEQRVLYPNCQQWYQCVLDVLQEYRQESGQKINGKFHQTLLHTLNSLTTITMQQSKVTNAIDFLFQFDQTLYSVANQRDLRGDVWNVFHREMQAQFFFHLGTLLLKKAQQGRLKWKEAVDLASACYLCSSTFKPPSKTAAWYVTSSEKDRTLLDYWYKTACHRSSQIGHMIKKLGMSFGNRGWTEWKDRIQEEYCTDQGKDKLFNIIFTLPNMRESCGSSYTINNDIFSIITPELPRDQQLRDYDAVSFSLCPEDLHQVVWVALQYYSRKSRTQPDYMLKLFEGLEHGILNLNSSSPETLCQLDIEAFLYAVVYVSAQKVDDEHRNSLLEPGQPSMLPSSLCLPLVTEDQLEWWKTVCKLYNNRTKEQLGKLRLTLQNGLEVIRVLGNHGMDISLVTHLARTFEARIEEAKDQSSHVLDFANEIASLQARAHCYWKAVVQMAESQLRGTSIRPPKKRLFEVAESRDEELVDCLQEGRYYLAYSAMTEGRTEEALEKFEHVNTPEAAFYQGQLYKKMANTELGTQMLDQTGGDDRNKQIALLTKSRDKFYLTLDRLRGDKSHALNAELADEIDDVESKLARIESDFVPRDISIHDEEESCLPLESNMRSFREPASRNPAFTASTPRRNLSMDISKVAHNKTSSSQILPASRTRPSPERLEAQMRHFTYTQDSVVMSLLEELKERRKLAQQTQEDIQTLRNDKEKLQYDIVKLNESVNSATRDRDNALQRMEYMKEDKVKLEEERKKLAQKETAAESAKEAAAKRVRDTESLMNKLEYQDKRLKDEKERLTEQKDKLVAEMKEVEEKRKKLEQDRTAFEEERRLEFERHKERRKKEDEERAERERVFAMQRQQAQQIQQQRADLYNPGYRAYQPPGYDLFAAAQYGYSPQQYPHTLMAGIQQGYRYPHAMAGHTPTRGPAQVGGNNYSRGYHDEDYLCEDEDDENGNENNGIIPPQEGSAYILPGQQPTIPSLYPHQVTPATVAPQPTPPQMPGPGFFSSPEKQAYPAATVIQPRMPMTGSPQTSSLVSGNPVVNIQPVPANIAASPAAAAAAMSVEGSTALMALLSSSALASQAQGRALYSASVAVPPPPSCTKFPMSMPQEVQPEVQTIAPTSSVPAPVTSASTTFAFAFKPTTSQAPVSAPREATEDDGDHNTSAGNDSYQEPHFEPLVSLPEVDVVTGEESEIVLVECRAKLFRFVDKQWKERGLGQIKILHNPELNKIRVVMRREQILKICANHYITPDMEINYKADKVKEQNVLTWRAFDFSDADESRLEQFCCKFKTAEIASEFKDAFEKGRDIVKKAESERAENPSNAESPQKVVATTEGENQQPGTDLKITTLEKGFGDKFKPKEGSWTCTGCYLTVAADVIQCLACETAKPGHEKEVEEKKAQKSSSTLSKFGGGGGNKSSSNVGAAAFGGATFGTSSSGGFGSSSSGGFTFGSSSLGGMGSKTGSASSISSMGSFTFGQKSTDTTVSANSLTFGMQKGAETSTDANSNEAPAKYTFGMQQSEVNTTTTSTTSTVSSTPLLTNLVASLPKPTGDPAAKPVFGGLTFTTQPVIAADDKKPTEPIKQDNKKDDDTSTDKKSEAKSSPFASFSFGSSGSKAPVAAFGQPSGTKSDVNPVFGQQSVTESNTAPLFGSTGFGENSFASAAKNNNTEAFTNSSDFKGFSGAGAQVFGSASTKSPEKGKKDQGDGKGAEEEYEPDVDFKPLVELPEMVDLKTGEEDEIVLFSHRSKLYRFDLSVKQWKERGVGEIKLLQHKTETKYRCVMRREQVLKLCANHLLTKDMKISALEGSEKTYRWIAGDYSEEELKQEMFAAKFKTQEVADNFKEEFEKCVKALNEAPVSSIPTVVSEQSHSLQEENRSTPDIVSSAQSLTDMFKLKPGEWECDACYVKNTSDSVSCAACLQVRPGYEDQVTSTTTTDNKDSKGLGFQFGGVSVTTPNRGFVFGSSPTKNQEPISTMATGTPVFGGFAFNKPTNEVTSSQSGPSSFTFGTPSNKVTSSTDSPQVSSTSDHQQTTSKSFAFGTSAFNFSGITPIKTTTDKIKTPIKSPLKSPLKSPGGGDEYYVDDEGEHIHFEPIVQLPDNYEHKTGEEEEEALYSHRCKLYRFVDGQWKERGIGDIKILKHKQSGNIRLLMRREQVLKICLNHRLLSDIELKPMANTEGKAWVWHADDYTEGELTHEQLAIRFKTKDIADDFKQVFDEAKAGKELTPVKVSQSKATEKPAAKTAAATPDQASGIKPKTLLDSFNFTSPESKPSSTTSSFKFGEQKFSFGSSAFGTESGNASGFSFVKPSQDTSTTVKTSEKRSEAVGNSLLANLLTSEETEIDGVSEPSSTLKSSVLDNDDVVCLGEKLPTKDQETRAQQYMLPKSFYFYENIDFVVCSGCRGCDSENFDFNLIGKSETDDDVVFLYEETSSPSKQDLIDKYQLPSNFYKYEHQEGCQGCPGCNKDSKDNADEEAIIQAALACITGDHGNIHYSKQLDTGLSADEEIVEAAKAFVTGDRGNIHYAKQLESKDEAVIQPSQASVTGDRGNIHYSKELESKGEDIIQPSQAFVTGDRGNIHYSKELESKENIVASVAAITGDRGNVHYAKELEKQEADSTTSSIFGGFSQSGGFDFAALAQQSNTGAAFGKKKDDTGPFQWEGAGASVFNTSKGDGDDADVEDGPDVHFEPLVQLPEVEVKTGEEDEQAVYSQRSKLYRYDNNQWKERGIGEMKILRHNLTGKYRLLHRREQVLKIACNHSITTDIKLTPMQTSENAWCWNAMDYTESEPKYEQFALRFKNQSLSQEFYDKFIQCQEELRIREETNCNEPDSTSNAASAYNNTKLEGQDSEKDFNSNAPDSSTEGQTNKPATKSDDEGTEDDQSEDDREVIFSKRATMFYIDDDMVAKNQGIGELEICVDDDILAYRVRMESDEANFLCNHIICRRHVIQKSEKKKFAEWTAKDFSTDEPIKRTFKVQFSSASATKEFYDIFNQGIQMAKESEVDEVADGANVTGELIFPQASAQGNN